MFGILLHGFVHNTMQISISVRVYIIKAVFCSTVRCAANGVEYIL